MGIVKKEANNLEDLNAFQIAVIDIIESFDYELLDLRYIEELKQVIVTLHGVVLFITPTDISLSFEINITPDAAGNLILILAEKIPTSHIYITDSFIITSDEKGNKLALFGKDAHEAYNKGLSQEMYNPTYLNILMNPNIKFFEC